MGKKGPMPDFETIDDYISNQPKETQKVLHELRSIIKEAAPDAIEGKGNPNDNFFAEYIGVLYSLSYGVKMSPKKGM